MTQNAPLTAEQFKEALPAKMKNSVSQAVMDEINTTLADPDLHEAYRDNLLSYAKVMAEGKFQVAQYVKAVKYVGYKLMGKSNLEAYSLTFPEKMADFSSRGVASKDQASYMTAYNKSKLVNLIYAQTMTPFWVLNQHVYQKAINHQAWLMINANSEKVQQEAANSLMTHLKPPEAQKVELDVGAKEDSTIAQLREAMIDLAKTQRAALQAGAVDAEFIAESSLAIEGDVVDEQ